MHQGGNHLIFMLTEEKINHGDFVLSERNQDGPRFQFQES